MAEKKKYYIFEVAKFIACIMIINSHCRELYPMQYLAVGGAFGNGIFFILSGYFNYNIKDNFNDWIAKKVARLMPAVLITILVEELINIIFYNKIIKPLDIINQYWFIFALFIYLFISYAILKSKNTRELFIFILLLQVIYVILYIINFKSTFFVELEGFRILKVIEYGIIYLYGGLFCSKEKNILNIIKSKKISNISLISGIVLSMFMWALIYFLVFAKEMFYRGQILIPLSIILFSLFVLVFSLNNKEINFTFAKKIVSLISASTLEIYLVQVTYQRFVHFNLFPIGLLCFWIFSLAIGCGFHISLSSMKQKLRK